MEINSLYMSLCPLSESRFLMYRDYVRSLLGPHVRFGFLVSIDQEYKDDVWQQTFSHGKDGKQLFFIETDSESEE